MALSCAATAGSDEALLDVIDPEVRKPLITKPGAKPVRLNVTADTIVLCSQIPMITPDYARRLFANVFPDRGAPIFVSGDQLEKPRPGYTVYAFVGEMEKDPRDAACLRTFPSGIEEAINTARQTVGVVPESLQHYIEARSASEPTLARRIRPVHTAASYAYGPGWRFMASYSTNMGEARRRDFFTRLFELRRDLCASTDLCDLDGSDRLIQDLGPARKR
jgi:hypothetical protein